MHHHTSPAALIADITAHPLRFVWQELRLGIPLCLGVALFLTAVFRDGFWINALYSLCIGLTIQGLIELGRYGAALWIVRRHPEETAGRLPWPGWRFMAPWVLVSAVLGYLLGASVAGAISGKAHLQTLLSGDGRPLGVIAMVVLAVSAGTTYFFYSRGRIAAIEAQAEAARRSAAETQLRLLQSQLEPHMLFNTLANLRVLIGLDPERAQAMLDRLVAFLRASLNASRSARHPLRDEFERLADYLALMAVRMGPRLQVQLDLPDELRDEPVPPLLLQPLVENSIRHGLEPQAAGGRIEVQARREPGRLVLTVRDDGAGLDAARTGAGGGFGTVQVRERLRTLYGEHATFRLEPAAGGGTLATITLPLPA